MNKDKAMPLNSNNSVELTIDKNLNDAIYYHQLGDLHNAKIRYEKILNTNSNHPVALHLLGLIADQVGEKKIALELILKALKIKPNYDEAHNNLGNIYRSLEKFDLAITHYRLALKLKPKVANVHYNIAISYDEKGDSSKAIEEYKIAISYFANNPIFHFNLANTYRSAGKLSLAEKEYRKVISIKPDYAEAYSQLANIKFFKKVDIDLTNMLQLFIQKDTSEDKKAFLAFGLGKAYEDLNDYDQSFEFIEIGNNIKRKKFNFDIKNWNDYVKKQITVFQKPLFEQLKNNQCQGNNLVFILGLPRSGTTLIEQIISNHKDVFSLGETPAFGRALNTNLNMDAYPKILQKIDAKALNNIAAQYLKNINNDDNSFMTDKMPDNFKVIGMIKLVFPNAKIIHCVRNGLDNCLSIYKNNFSSNDIVYAYSQTELGHYYLGYKELMAHWHKVIPNFIYDIKYEDMVNDQEQQTRNLLKFCDLEWDDKCLRFYENNGKVQTASAVQVRKPIYNNSIKLWEKYTNKIKPLIEILNNSRI